MALGVGLLLAGAFANGTWLAAIGWFLAAAARSSYAELQVRQLLHGVRAEDLMVPAPVAVPAGASLREAVNGYFLRYEQNAFLVDDGGHPLGVLTLAAVKRIARGEWGARSVRELTQALDVRGVVPPETPAGQVVERLEGDGIPVFVSSDGRIVGEITPSQVGRYLKRRRAVAA